VIAIRALAFICRVDVTSKRLVVLLELPNVTLALILVACEEIEIDNCCSLVEVVAVGGELTS
jgi:hypothetical protein